MSVLFAHPAGQDDDVSSMAMLDVQTPQQAWLDLAEKATALLDRFEASGVWAGTVPQADVDTQSHVAFRCRRVGALNWQLLPVTHVAPMNLDALLEIDEQKQRLLDNTEQFVRGLPANHVLLTGARGTGKSSLIKAVLQRFHGQGLRLIEMDKDDLLLLPDVMQMLAEKPQRFIVYCDDLSFDEGESGYKALKSALDGTISAASDNVLIYATSNRRHLLPEKFSDNLNGHRSGDGEIHPGEAIEEKISLSERFGLWLSFYPFSQAQYVSIVNQWLEHLGANGLEQEQAKPHALTWATQRGSRSGRVAQQFARDWVGRAALSRAEK